MRAINGALARRFGLGREQSLKRGCHVSAVGNPAVVQHQRAGADGLDLEDVVRDEDQSATFVQMLADVTQAFALEPEISNREHLVEQQQVAGHTCVYGEAKTCPHARTVCLHRRIEFLGQFREILYFDDPVRQLRAPDAPPAESHRRILPTREQGIERAAELDDAADAAADDKIAAVWLQNPRDEPHQGRLPGSVRTHHRQGVAGLSPLLIYRLLGLWHRSAMTRHLIHIGFPKTGSSFLQEWFKRHPQLCYLHGRVAGIDNVFAFLSESFEAPQPPWRVTSAEAFAVPNRDAGNLPEINRPPTSKEITAAQKQACEMLFGLFPGAYILVVTRGFRSVAFSAYSQYVRLGVAHSLEDVMRRPDLGLSDWNYDEVIAHYRAAFGDRVIVMPYELLAEDQDAFLRELERRLGIDRQPFSEERVNHGLSTAELCWYPRISRLMRRMTRGRGWLWRLYASLLFRNRLALPIRLVNRLWPAHPLTAASIDDETLRPLGSLARKLVDDPLYGPYRADYQN